MLFWRRRRLIKRFTSVNFIYSYFEKGCWKKCARDNPEGNMGYDQCTVTDTEAVKPTFVALL